MEEIKLDKGREKDHGLEAVLDEVGGGGGPSRRWGPC